MDKKLWKKGAEGGHSLGLRGYLMATEEIVEVLNQIIETNTSPKNLKDELLEFYKERKNFVTYAQKNVPKT